MYVYREWCDMRRSFDGLAGLAQHAMNQDSLSGHLFVFMNRSKNALKVLYWDRSGYALWYKRLEKGRYQMPGKVELSGAELVCILEGIDIEKTPRKRHFSYDSLCAEKGEYARK